MNLRNIKSNVDTYFKLITEISESKKNKNFENALKLSLKSLDYIESLLIWDIYDSERGKLLEEIIFSDNSINLDNIEEDTWELLGKKIEININSGKEQLNIESIPCISYLLDYYSVFGNEEIIIRIEDLLKQYKVLHKWNDDFEKSKNERKISEMMISLLKKQKMNSAEIKKHLSIDYNIRWIIDRLIKFNVIEKDNDQYLMINK